MQQRAEKILEAGQDLQLHVHPCWLSFTDGKLNHIKPNDRSTQRPLNELIDIFEEAKQRFTDWGVGKPVAVRTGNFSTGLDTFQACYRTDLLYTSNIASLDSTATDLKSKYQYGFHLIEGVTELPLTSFHARDLQGKTSRRILAITACSLAEMISVLEQAWEQGLKEICLLTHPFEFVNRDNVMFENMRVNKINQQRFIGLCEFIASNSARFQTAVFAQLPGKNVLENTVNQAELRGSYWQMLKRTQASILNKYFG